MITQHVTSRLHGDVHYQRRRAQASPWAEQAAAKFNLTPELAKRVVRQAVSDSFGGGVEGERNKDEGNIKI